MASNMQSFPRMLKMLRENSNFKEKREALTYIRRNSKKLESTKAIKEEQYKELCKLVVDAFANGSNDIQNEAYETLSVIILEFKDHTLNLFEAMSQISQKHRLKILKLLEVVEENAISTFAYDAYAVNFFYNCMCTINTNTMPWTAPTACVDNIQALIEAESKPLSDDQRLEEETINYCVILLRRLYKVAAITSDIKVQRFNALLMDKVTILAYMGHKRQRGPALKLLQQALATKTLSYVRTKLAAAWSRYLSALQSTYCKRMLLLVSACELDWATQWNVSIQFLGVDLHRGASLINNLLSVEEKAFKSTDTIIRRQAFLSWKLLVDNFALDPKELATARRIKLLCIPLNAKNSKTELIALTKLEVWWHVIIKLYKDISQFVNPVITQFLNFCFGPLGDTPLLSSKYDIVASPGKRFFKTKVVAVDALCQLLVTKQNHTVFSPILEERLPHSISDTVFQECYKSIIHSVGEALLVLSQLTDSEMKKRYQLAKMLWTSLVNYVQESKMEKKDTMYKDIISVITELANYAGDKLMIKNLLLDTILFEIADLSKDFNFEDDTLFGLVFKLLETPIFNTAEKKHYAALKSLFWHCIKSQKQNVYYSHAFNCLKEMYEKLHVLLTSDKKESVILELWIVLADALEKYMSDIQEINEGSATEHNLKTVESIVAFPFIHLSLEDQTQVQELAEAWKYLYKQFEMRTDLITTVKSNEILLNIATVMQRCLTENERSAYLTIHCLDSLLRTVNYKLLVANTEVPSLVQLIVDLVIYFISNKKKNEGESALKALSSVIITVYGQSSEKIVPYLQVCKPAIEIMLQSELKSLYKEVTSTWEVITSIFKGLGKQLDYDLLSSYEKAIIQASNHSSLDIQIFTVSLFELKDIVNSSTKLILEEMEKESSTSNVMNKSEYIKKRNDQVEKSANKAKPVGPFVRIITSPKLTVKDNNKNDKITLIDADSQEYVLIQTDLRIDVGRLTEHQKECFKRRKDNIPALYNDLSQSSSQDTQNLQEWFDKKSKILEEPEKGYKKDNVSIKNKLDDDANKENKIELKELETANKLIHENDTKSAENVEQNVSLECAQKVKGNVDNNENSLIENQMVTLNGTVAKTSADFVSTDLHYNVNVETEIPVDFVSKDMYVQEELLENCDDQRLSPSVLDSGKRRNRSNTAVRSESEEIVSSQSGQLNAIQGTQRMLRTKVIHCKPENVENKSVKEEKRGIKRKAASDSESDGGSLRQRRKSVSTDVVSDSDSCKVTENENAMNLQGITDESNLSQRTRNEISRLRINMVFDSPLSTSRRSKSSEDKEIITRKVSPETRSKLKTGDVKIGDPMKRSQKTNDKELKITNRQARKSLTLKKRELEEPKEVEDKEKTKFSEEDSSENVLDNKCDLSGTKKSAGTNDKIIDDDESRSETQSIDTDENAIPAEGRSQAQNDVEDIIEDSQEPHALGKNKLSKIKKIEKQVEVSKTGGMKKTLQNKKCELEGEMEVEEKGKEENVQTKVTSKIISDNISDPLDTRKSTKINFETVNDDKPSSETQNTDENEESEEVMEDIIESSQELSNLEKKCNEKQCFVKINKIDNISPSRKIPEAVIDVLEANKSVLNNCDNDNNEVPTDNFKGFEETNEVNIAEPKNSTVIIENNVCDNEKETSETQRANDSSAFKSLLEFSSPKSNVKRQTKFKSYSGQGRAAHMLGLVTKQARMEAECSIISIEDEPPVKKVKCKDTDNDALLGKREQGLMPKEVDKVTAACSSRQEKIFSNMRSADYCPSPAKLFSNLKNDGEKIFSKTDKSMDSTSMQTDVQIDKVSEEVMQEADELPILEWSSANPPSLTASPSASILKRQRQSIPEPDPDATTPNKRKRVSFADPPVSKEMGYEITSTDSPKSNKLISRGLLIRKDSPLRLKQIKQKLISLDADKMEKDEEVGSEVDLQCERENELLTKIAEELEYTEVATIDTDMQASYNSVQDESINAVSTTCNKIKIDNLNAEYEISQNSMFSKHAEATSVNKVDQNKKDETLEIPRTSNVSSGRIELDSTQEDIFNGIDKTQDVDYIEIIETINEDDTSVLQYTSMNNSIDPLKFDTGNDSIIEYSSEKCTNSENLEDTMDVANLTVLNSSVNSDEIFCGKLMRTSTQASDNAQEQDTLPVTDSIFGSLPLSQESQNTSELHLDPELLDATLPIYPALLLCKEPITSIIKELTNPLWVQHLSIYLSTRNVQTISDLARLSEREINRLPIKGKSKVEFVKSVLKNFEETYVVKEMSNAPEDADVILNNEVSCSVNTNVPVSVLKLTPQDKVLKVITDETQNKSVNHSILLSQPSTSKVFDNVIITDKNTSEMFMKATESSLNEFLNTSAVDNSKTDSTSRTIASVGKSSNVVAPHIAIVSIGSLTSSAPEAGSSTSSTNSTIAVTQATKTVGTCTSNDSVYLSKMAVNKATKSVASQMALEDLLDEIDVNLVLESATRRCTPEKLLMQYKEKMKHVSQGEFETETIKMLGAENRKYPNEVTLKAACRLCGLNKVLLRLPDIFSADKEFFVKVLNTYKKKIQTSDCLNILDFNEVKDTICQRCSSSELAEMLSTKLKEEEQRGIWQPMTEISSLDAMLKRMPMDVIISHTVANDELIPSRVVLDIALQNNGPSDIVQALESQSSPVSKNVFDKLWSSQFAVEHIDQFCEKEDLFKIFKAVSSKLSRQDLLQAFYDAMNIKLLAKSDKD